jgi:hypothetical protein
VTQFTWYPVMSRNNKAINCDTPTPSNDWLRIKQTCYGRLRTVKKHNKKATALGHSPVERLANDGAPTWRLCEGGPESVDTSPYCDTANWLYQQTDFTGQSHDICVCLPCQKPYWASLALSIEYFSNYWASGGILMPLFFFFVPFFQIKFGMK